jgi:multidrug efflux pump subunit AcrB
MDFLTRFGINKSRLTILIMIGLIVQGLFSYINLPKREDPAVTIRSAIVSVVFPGMSPERMEDVIVTKIERKLREIGEVEDIKALVSTGSTVITVNIYETVSNADLSPVFQEIRNKMKDLEGDLPSGSHGPFVNTSYGNVAVATVAVTGEGFSIREIFDAAEDLQKSLYAIKGISKVTLYGEQEERIWLDMDSRKLAAVGVQINQVLSDLRAQNVILPAGQLDAAGVNLTLEANGDLGSVEEIENVLTKVPGLAGFVRLKDLMTIRRGYKDPKVKPVFYNGQPAIMAAIEMSDGADIQELGRRIKKAVQTFEQSQPIGISYRFSTYQEAKVTVAINNALLNVAQTLAVVLVVMVVFLGFRAALIIACIVPFTVTFALIAMGNLGIDLQQVSIAAVIISLGLLVDNGLVVVEDIQDRVAKGTPSIEAALSAGRQFVVPLAVASVTTMSAFLPLLLMEGTAGEYGFSMGMVVAVMLLGSWVTALYILPTLSSWLIKPNKNQTDTPEQNTLVRVYGAIVRRSLPFSAIIIIFAYVAVVGAGTMFSGIKKEMFPLSERNQFLIYMDMPKGAAISRTEARAKSIDRWLRDKKINPEVTDTTLYVGAGGPRFYLSLNPADTVPSSAFFLVNTTDFKQAITAANRAQRYLLEYHPEARFKIKRLAMGGSESGIVEIKISGPDADVLLARAKDVEIAFADAPGIVQNENNWGNKIIKMVIDVAQDKARELGLTSEHISNVMQAYFSGKTISTFRDGSDSIPIVVRAGHAFRDSIEDLKNLSIIANGQLISLDQVARFTPKLELYQLRRFNQQREIKISAKSDVLSGAELLAFVQPKLMALNLGPQYKLQIDGETKTAAETNEKLAAGMPIALAVMLVALMFQFNSARRVLLTFMTIPLVIIGAPFALLATGQPLSFFAILGMISLAGIIINNAIVLIDQVDIERKTLALKEAVVAAAQKRVTPILLTSLTTVLGLLPMAIGGGALFEPMAALMIGGLAVGSVISLFFVPGGYYLLFRFDKQQAHGSARKLWSRW